MIAKRLKEKRTDKADRSFTDKTDESALAVMLEDVNRVLKSSEGARSLLIHVRNHSVFLEERSPMSDSCLTGQSSPAYETDFYAWTQQQAKFLQEEKWSCLDVPNLVEEIESLGRQERRELKNRLGILLGYLLKWEFQPQSRSRSWLATIREQRFQVLQLLAESPSLQPKLPEAMETAYQSALNLAVRETSLSYKVFPQECPYSLEQVLDSGFLAGQQSDFDEE